MSRWFRTYGFADVYDGLVVGAIPLDVEDVRTLQWIGVERILNLVGDKEYTEGARQMVVATLADAEIQEHRIPIVDYGSLSIDVLNEAVTVVNRWLDDGHTVYLHCRAGWQRSATVAAGVLAVRNDIDVDRALRAVRSRRPSANPLPHQRDDLRRWWASPDRGELSASPDGGRDIART